MLADLGVLPGRGAKKTAVSSKAKKPKVESKASYLLFTKTEDGLDRPLDAHTFLAFEQAHPALARLLRDPTLITEAEIQRVVTTKE